MLKNFTPQQDWNALDLLTENEAKLLLRQAVASIRCVRDTVVAPFKDESYTPNGHAISYGHCVGFILNFEMRVREAIDKQAKDPLSHGN